MSKRLIAKNKQIIKLFLMIVVAALSIGIAVVALFVDFTPGGIESFLFSTIALMGILNLFLFEVALLWYFDYHLERREKISVDCFNSPITFAAHRERIVAELAHLDSRDKIYYMGNASFFSNIEQVDDVKKKDIQEKNQKLFKSIARMSLEASNTCSFRSIVFSSNRSSLSYELEQQVNAFKEVSDRNGLQFSEASFRLAILKDYSVKDYLIVGDHLFKTIRKYDRDDNNATYVHIHCPVLAHHYRSWIEDIYDQVDDANSSVSKQQGKKLLEEVKGASG